MDRTDVIISQLDALNKKLAQIQDSPMEDKQFEMLGRQLARMFDEDEVNRLSHTDTGKTIYIYIKYLELEAQRDARDKANGKGK
jgi:hypothetical protein